MKRLILCNTYYQLLIAIQMKNSKFKKDKVSVVISDTPSKNVEAVYERLKEIDFFENVYFIKLRNEFDKNGIKGKFSIISDCVTGNNHYIQKTIGNLKVDEFIFDGIGYGMLGLYAYLYKNNNKLIVSMMEEGIAVYDWFERNVYKLFNNKMKIMYFLMSFMRTIENKPLLHKIVKKYYCFHPEFYHGVLEAVQIPLIEENDDVVSKVVSKIFDVTKNVSEIKEKYIFFAGIGDFEGEKPIGEVKIATEIAEIVGKENFIVKLHPRDASGNFEKSGLKILTNSQIPWEAIQLNGNYSDKVFLSATSGSVLGVNMILEKKIKTVFLFDLCDLSNNSAVKIAVDKFADLFGTNNILDDICIAKSMDDVTKIIEQK